MNFKRRVATFLIGTAALATVAEPASACQCAIGNSPQMAINGAPVIFSGRVIEVLQGVVEGRSKSLIATIDVLERWKGAVPDRVTVYGSSEGASCGYSHFTVGEVTTLLTYPLPSRTPPLPDLTTDICTMVPIMQQPATVMRMLHELRAVQGAVDTPPVRQ